MQVSIACNVGGGASGGGEHALKERRAANHSSSRTRAEPSRTGLHGHAHMNEAPGHHGNMMYRSLGKSGLRVSCLGLDTWLTFNSQISDEEAETLVTLAYESGVNLFDTAEVFSAGRAENTLGSVLKKKGWSRSTFVVTTKIYWGGQAETERGLSRKHIIEGLRTCLDRLQLDYVDVVFACRCDVVAPVEEVVRAMSFVVEEGLAVYWGTSDWNCSEIMGAFSVARQLNLVAPVCEQSQFHYFHRDKVKLPQLYHQIGVGVVTWSPLACGKNDQEVPASSRANVQFYVFIVISCVPAEERTKRLSKVRELHRVAERLNCSVAQLAIAWCLRCVGVSSVLMVLSLLDHSVMSQMDFLLGNRPQISSSDTNA
ncbi:hypothetical protein WMY93_014145 [Mugilogobius chulae]|uniref:NADP-dependent oxidoreductase domain-containing protein n=1 Tax=Mugilogobius chulae TaxID=88201 RepID=A0AAW0P3N5_9GOBI